MKSLKTLTASQVRRIADLARLGLTEREIEKFRRQLSAIIDFVGKLNEVNTENIEPTSQVTGLENVFREDTVKPSLSQKEVLKNAPVTYKGFFKVNQVLEE